MGNLNNRGGMRRWPFALVAIACFAMNMSRLSPVTTVGNDPVSAIYFVGYLLSVAIAISIKGDDA
jgi:hypothetical protein